MKHLKPITVVFRVNDNTKIEISYAENMRMDTFITFEAFYRSDEGKKWKPSPECNFSLDEVLAEKFARHIMKARTQRKKDVLKKQNDAYRRLLSHYSDTYENIVRREKEIAELDKKPWSEQLSNEEPIKKKLTKKKSKNCK